MAKQKKKRTKKYSGVDAAMSRPSVTRVEAVQRSAFGHWWFEKKRIIRPIAIAALVVLIIGWLIYELIRLIVNA
jgi:hypothetical protein